VSCCLVSSRGYVVSPPAELGREFDEDMTVSELTAKQVGRIPKVVISQVQKGRDVSSSVDPPNCRLVSCGEVPGSSRRLLVSRW
jgi:hypothetical protein